MHTYNQFGWYSGESFPGRDAGVAPANLSQTTTPGEMRANWTGHAWVDRPYQVAVPALDTASLAERIAAKRYAVEIGGISIGGMPIDTDRQSQALITGAVVAAMVDPAYVCRWKTGTGFVDLSAAELIAIGTAVRSHVQACFDREAVLLAAVADGSFAEGMLDEGWPNA